MSVAGNILIAGETEGSNDGGTAGSADRFIRAIVNAGYSVQHISAERCGAEFPLDRSALEPYTVVVLSDVRALTLLLSPDARSGRPGTNRLSLLADWVRDGGSLMMAGGYSSYQGIDGLAGFSGTAVDLCLPIACQRLPDGLEIPEGITPRLVDATHPIVTNLQTDWPPVLGLNDTEIRTGLGVRLIAACEYNGRQIPLLAVRAVGKGKTLAWTTDIGPHWMSAAFMEWSGYDMLVKSMMDWLH